MYSRLLLSITLISLNVLAIAQQVYPVQLNGILIPPHSLDLSVYAQERTQDLSFNAILNDPVEPFREVRLRLSVVNNGQELYVTDPNLAVPTIQLNQFQMETFNGFALQPYLSPFSLIGANGGQGSLVVPEGINDICLEVIDIQRNVPISRKACRSGIFNLNQPPQLLLPSCGEQMEFPETQNLLFNWTPMHLGSGNSPGAVEYTFELVELLPGIMDPNDGFENALQVYQTTVMTPSFLYTQAEPLLEPGKNYAWRVQARSLIHPTSMLFSNEGYSQVCTFSYSKEGDGTNSDDEEDQRAIPQGCEVFSTDFGSVNGTGASSIPLVEGDIVKLGYFDLEVLDANPGGEGMTGTGFITVPMLKSKVQVNFTNLRVKQSMRAYGMGDVSAIVETDYYLDPSLMVPGNIENMVTAEYIEDISKYFENGIGQNKLISQFDAADPKVVSLPVGMDRELNGEAQPLVTITALRFTERNAYMTAISYTRMEDGSYMRYAGVDIEITPNGLKSNSMLAMLDGELNIPLTGIFQMNVEGGNSGSGMTVDCQGFKDFDLHMEVQISEEIMVQEGNGQAIVFGLQSGTNDPAKYLGGIEDFDAFVIPNLPDFRFKMGGGQLDLNQEQKIALQDNGLFAPANDNGWKGLYLENVNVDLPAAYDFSGNGTSINLGPNSMFVTEEGVFGQFQKANLIGFDEGSIGGWRYSVDTLQLNLEASETVGTTLAGRIQVPLLDDPFDYKGNLNINSSITVLDVNPSPGKRKMSLWNGEFDVASTTRVGAQLKDMGEQGRQFFSDASLTGKINIQFDSSQFNEGLAGNKGLIKARIFQILGQPRALDFSLENLQINELNIDPYYLPEERYVLGGFEKEGSKLSIGGKSLEVGTVEIKYSPKGADDKEELGFDIIVLDGNNQLQFTFWAVLDDTGVFVFDRIEVETEEVNCNCTSFNEFNFDPSGLGDMLERYYDQYYDLPSYDQAVGSLASIDKETNLAEDGNWRENYKDAVMEYLWGTLENTFPVDGNAIVIPFLNNQKLQFEDVPGKKRGRKANVALTFPAIDAHTSKQDPVVQLPIDISKKLSQLAITGSIPSNARLLITGFELASGNNQAKIEFTYLEKIKEKYLEFKSKPGEWPTANYNSVALGDMRLYLQDSAHVEIDKGFKIAYLSVDPSTPMAQNSYVHLTCNGFKNHHVQGEYHVPYDSQKSDSRKLNYYNYTDNTSKQLKVAFIIITDGTKAKKSLTQFIAPVLKTNEQGDVFNMVMEGQEGLVFNFGSSHEAYFDCNALTDDGHLPSSYSRHSGSPGIFKGLIFKRMQLHLRGLYSDNQNGRLQIPCADFVFDQNFGLEGEVDVKNSVPWSSNALMGGWRYSLEKFNFKFVNNMSEGLIELRGKINIPILKADQTVPYYGKLSYKKDGAGSGNSGEFEPSMEIELGDGSTFYQSQSIDNAYELEYMPGVFLFFDHKSSVLTMDYDNGEFEPGCDLSGTATIMLHKDLATGVHGSIDLLARSGINFSLPGLTFANLKLNDPGIETNCKGTQTVGGIKSIHFGTWGLSKGGVEQPESSSSSSPSPSPSSGSGTDTGGLGGASSGAANAPKNSNSKFTSLKSKVATGFQNFPISVGTPTFRCTNADEYKFEIPIAVNLMPESQDKDDGGVTKMDKASSDRILGGASTSTAKGGTKKKSKTAGIKAETQLGFYFRKDAQTRKLTYKSMTLDALSIEAAYGPVTLTGKLAILKNEGQANAKWGEGFKAKLEIAIEGMKKGGVAIKALTQFASTNYGRTDGGSYRYFFADLEVLSETGILLTAVPPIRLHGGGGGFYYNMSKKPPNEDYYDEVAVDKNKKQTEDVNVANIIAPSIANDPDMAPGVSLSGFQYEPADQSYGGYIMGVFSIVNPQAVAVDGAVGFQISKNSAGKLAFHKLFIKSSIYVSPETIIKRKESSTVFTGDIEMDFIGKILTGSFGAKVDYQQPQKPLPAIRTLTMDPSTAKGSFYFKFRDNSSSWEVEKWNIMAGRSAPGQRMLGVFNQIAPIPVKDLNIEAYLQAGQEIDPMPSINDLIPEWNSDKKAQSRYFDPASHKKPGFAMGMAFKFPKKDFSFLMFEAGIEAGMGFDMLFTKYDKVAPYICEGKPVGINGWYLQGQVWAYLNANLSMNYSLPFKSGKISIFDVRVGAFLQAKFPHPSQLKGAIKGKYSVLGGLIKGNVNFKFEVNDGKVACLNAINSAGLGPLSGIKVVSENYPDNKDSDIPIFVEPKLVFSMPIGRDLEFEDIDDLGETKYLRFRSEMEYFRLKKGGIIINTQIIQDDYYSMRLKTNELLEPQTVYTFEYKIKWKEQINGNWVDVQGGVETETIQFTTGNMPDKIVAGLLDYHAPGLGQRYWHKGYAQPKLVFKQGDHQRLFPASQNVTHQGKQIPITFDYIIRLTEFHNGTQSNQVDFPLSDYPGLETFETTVRKVKSVGTKFWLPFFETVKGPSVVVGFEGLDDHIKADRFYRLQVIRLPILPKTETTQVEKNVSTETGQDATTVNIAVNRLAGATDALAAQHFKILYDYYFASSKFNHLHDKLAAVNKKWQPSSLERKNDIGHEVDAKLNQSLQWARPFKDDYWVFEPSGTEGFDKYDLTRIQLNMGEPSYNQPFFVEQAFYGPNSAANFVKTDAIFDFSGFLSPFSGASTNAKEYWQAVIRKYQTVPNWHYHFNLIDNQYNALTANEITNKSVSPSFTGQRVKDGAEGNVFASPVNFSMVYHDVRSRILGHQMSFMDFMAYNNRGNSQTYSMGNSIFRRFATGKEQKATYPDADWYGVFKSDAQVRNYEANYSGNISLFFPKLNKWQDMDQKVNRSMYPLQEITLQGRSRDISQPGQSSTAGVTYTSHIPNLEIIDVNTKSGAWDLSFTPIEINDFPVDYYFQDLVIYRGTQKLIHWDGAAREFDLYLNGNRSIQYNVSFPAPNTDLRDHFVTQQGWKMPKDGTYTVLLRYWNGEQGTSTHTAKEYTASGQRSIQPGDNRFTREGVLRFKRDIGNNPRMLTIIANGTGTMPDYILLRDANLRPLWHLNSSNGTTYYHSEKDYSTKPFKLSWYKGASGDVQANMVELETNQEYHIYVAKGNQTSYLKLDKAFWNQKYGKTVLLYNNAVPFTWQTAPALKPYNGAPIAIPGTIKFNQFGLGGNGIAYFDKTPYTGTTSKTRPGESVDIHNQYKSVLLDPGERLDFIVNVTKKDKYNFVLDYYCSQSTELLFELSGGMLPDTFSVIPVGHSVDLFNEIELPQGQYTLKVFSKGTNPTSGILLGNLFVRKSVPAIAVKAANNSKTAIANNAAYAIKASDYQNFGQVPFKEDNIKKFLIHNPGTGSLKFKTKNLLYTNVAQGKPASTHSVMGGGVASRAVDGNTSGVWEKNEVMLTNMQQGSWLTIDLQNTYELKEIIIYNRTGSYTDCFGKYYVMVGNSPFPATTDVNQSLGIAHWKTPVRNDNNKVNWKIPLPSGTKGRYVRVQLANDYYNYLTMAEIMVLGRPAEANSFTVSGSNAADFSIVSAPSLIEPGKTGEISINCNSGIIGARTAVVNIKSNAPSTPTWSFPVKAELVGPRMKVTGAGNSFPTSNDSLLNIGDIGAYAHLNFNNVLVKTSSKKSYKVSNWGLGKLGITRVYLTGQDLGDFSILRDVTGEVGYSGLSGTIDPIIEVELNAKTAGTKRAVVNILSDDPANPHFAFPLKAVVIAPEIDIPLYSWSTNFGTLNKGEEKKHTFSLINLEGTYPLILGDSLVEIVGSDEFIVTKQPPKTIPPGPGFSHTFDIVFRPKSPGTKNATIQIENNDPDENPFILPITGVCEIVDLEVYGNGKLINNGDLSPKTANLTDFGAVPQNAETTKTFNLRNTGSVPVHIHSISVEGIKSFTIPQKPSAPIKPGGSQSFTIRHIWHSITQNPQVVNIRVSYSKSGGAKNYEHRFAVQAKVDFMKIAVSVQGGKSEELTPQRQFYTPKYVDMDFGNLSAGTTHTKNITIHNLGKIPVKIDNITYNPPQNFWHETTSFSPIPPGGSITLPIKAKGTWGTGLGAQSKSFNINCHGISYGFSVKANYNSPEIQFKDESTGVYKNYYDVGVVDFGFHNIDSTVKKSFRIVNKGSVPLILPDNPPINIEGAQAGDFRVSIPPASTIPPKSYTSFEIQFSPTDEGKRSAYMTLFGNALQFYMQGFGPSAIIGVEYQTGYGINTKYGINYGAVPTGSKAKTFVIRNKGNKPLILAGNPKVRTSGANPASFKIIKQPVSPIAPGSTATFTVEFTKLTSSNMEEATVSIQSNDNNTSNFSFPVKGIAVPPDCKLFTKKISYEQAYHSGLVYGTMAIGDYLHDTLIINNRGKGTLEIYNITHGDLIEMPNKPTGTILLEEGDSVQIGFKFTHQEGSSLTYSKFITLVTNDYMMWNGELNGDGQQTIGFVSSTGKPKIRLRVEGTDYANPQEIYSPFHMGYNVDPNIGAKKSFSIFVSWMNAPVRLDENSPIKITGAHPYDFKVSKFPANRISYEDMDTDKARFEIQFTPTAGGTRNATVEIRSNDQDNPTFSFDITGEGKYVNYVKRVEIYGNNQLMTNLSVPSLQHRTDFGSVILGDTIIREYKIKNIGNAVIKKDSYQNALFIGSSDWSWPYLASTIPGDLQLNKPIEYIVPGDSIRLKVAFIARQLGESTNSISVGETNNPSNIIDFALKANVVNPNAVAKITAADATTFTSSAIKSHNFGEKVPGTGAVTKTFKLWNAKPANPSNANLVVRLPKIIPSGFKLSLSDTTIYAGQSVDLVASFEPKQNRDFFEIIPIKLHGSTQPILDLVLEGKGVPPPPAEALAFDGVDDKLILNTPWQALGGVNQFSEFTLSFWMKPETPKSGIVLVDSGTEMIMATNGDLSAFRINTGVNLLDNQWHHLAWVQDVNNIHCYVDGRKVASTTPQHIPGSLVFGNRRYFQFYKGLLDEVSIWSAALDETKIKKLMTCSPDSSDCSLVAYYDFAQGKSAHDNSSVTNLLDRSANGHDIPFASSPFALTGSTSNFVDGGASVSGICDELGGVIAEAGPNKKLTCIVGTVQIDASGSSSGVTYSWTGPGTFTSTQQNPTVDSSGLYNLTVTSASGCSATDYVKVEEDLNPPTADVGSQKLITCDSSSVKLQPTAPVTGLTYTWTGPNSFSSNTLNPSISSAGTYTFTVTDSSNGCTASDDVVILEEKTIPIADAGNDLDLSCNVSSVILDGNGSDAGMEYNWTGPGNFTASEQSPTVKTPGAYTISVRHPVSGCTGTDQVIVNDLTTAPIASAGSDVTIDWGANRTLGNTAQSNHVYSWSPSTDLSDASIAQPVANPTKTTVYTLSVTNTATGCTATDTIQVSVRQPAQVLWSPISITSASSVTGSVAGTSGFIGGSMDFGNQVLNKAGNQKSLKIWNTAGSGAMPLTVTLPAFPEGYTASLSPSNGLVQPGQSVTLQVAFQPDQLGYSLENVDLGLLGAGAVTKLSISLSGNGVAPPAQVKATAGNASNAGAASINSLAFSEVLWISDKTMTAKIWNNAPESYAKELEISLPNDIPYHYKVSLEPSTGKVSPGQSATLTVKFDPEDEGNYNYNLKLELEGTNGVKELPIALSGKGVGPEVATALHFDGVDDYVDIGDPGLGSNPNATIEFWINPENLSASDMRLMGNLTGSSSPAFCLGFSNGKIKVWGQQWWEITSSALPKDKWTHIALTFDGTSITGYFNGTAQLTRNTSTNFTQLGLGAKFLKNWGQQFQGKIDELRIWNRTLTEDEIQHYKDCPLSGTETGLVGYWSFNQGFAGFNNSGEAILKNEIQNGSAGTLTNFGLNGTQSNWVSGSPVSGNSCPVYLPPAQIAVTDSESEMTASAIGVLNFESEKVGVGKSLALKIWNSAPLGAKNLNWSAGTNSGDYSLSQSSGSIAPQQSVDLTVTFKPTSTGNRNSTLSINGAGKTVIVELNGEGIQTVMASTLHFDGVDDYINLGDPGLGSNPNATIEFWIRPEDLSVSDMRIMGNLTGTSSPAFGLGFSNGKIKVWGQQWWEITSSALPKDQWTHIAIAYDGNKITGYFNGEPQLTRSTSTNFTQIGLGGKFLNQWGKNFKGKIDEFRIWKRTLSEDEIKHYRDCALTGKEAGLAAYWNFNQGYENADNSSLTKAASGLSSGGADGTLFGFALNKEISNWTGGSPVMETSCSVYVPKREPYSGTPIALPGKLEFENYDKGGEGITYHDNELANYGGQYRQDGVDIESNGSRVNIGYLDVGEWLEYTVNVSEAGTYLLDIRYANPGQQPKLKFLLDGSELAEVSGFQSTGAWGTYTTGSFGEFDLPAGNHILRLEIIQAGINLDYLEVKEKPLREPYSGSPIAIPGKLEFENYDKGGEGITYHDNEVANYGGQYRQDGVDIESNGSRVNLGYLNIGEWLEYTVNVSEAGTYLLDIRYANPGQQPKLKFLLDGVALTEVSNFQNTGGWGNYTTGTMGEVALPAGNHILRMEILQAGINLDYLEIK